MQPIKKLVEPAFFLLLFIFSFWLMFHTFSYNGKTHDIEIGIKLWSDFGAHIPLIRSFSMGHNWPVEYPIFPGEPIRYHFLFDMLVGLLEKIGIRLDWALNVPSGLGFFALLMLLYRVAKKLFASVEVAVLTVVFFLFNGSLAFVRFFMLHPLSAQSLKDILNAHEFPAFAPWGPGDITAFWNLNIYTNQRHLALAFALVLFFVYTVIRLKKLSVQRQIMIAIPWGLVFGILPYFHQPSLLIVAVFLLCYFFIYPASRVFFIIIGVVSFALILPQIGLAVSGAKTIEFFPGYLMNADITTQSHITTRVLTFLSFWWHNLGLHSVFILVGFFLIPKTAKKVLFPIFPLFIIANLFKFSVEISASHKFFNFALILGQMITAYVIVRFFNHMRIVSRGPLSKAVIYLVTGLVLIMCTLSGIIDFAVVANDTKMIVSDIPKNKIAAWIAENTPKNAIFLNSSYFFHPASLAGRPIFLGWPYFSWSAGYTEDRFPPMKVMYETRDKKLRCSLLQKYHISYVTVENVHGDNNLPFIDLQYFLKTYPSVYVSSHGPFAIFSTEEMCSVH